MFAPLLLSQNAVAADNGGPFFGEKATGKWIVGVKVGKIDDNVKDIKDADALGIVLGYEFDSPIEDSGSSTFELEYVSGDATNLQGIGEYNADIISGFFTYRSAGTLYFKVKAGLSYTEIETNTPLSRDTYEDVSLAAGIGLGYHVGDYGVLELEYSQDSSDTDLGILALNALLEF
jgi:hypothetical protein